MQYKMIDVGPKPMTERRAIAQGKILLSREAFSAIQNGKNPKGNVLALAESAGIMAAKKTSELIPLCHPLPIDHIKLSFSMNPQELSITVLCEVGTIAKTGVEMEALSGVNGALLTVYDLSKAVDPVLKLTDIRLNLKEGGKSGRWVHPDAAELSGELKAESEFADCWRALKGIRGVVLTMSDRAFAGQMEDTSGPALVDFLKSLGCDVCSVGIVPDEKFEIQSAIKKAIHENHADLILTTGGTGLSPRDKTPEAIQEMADRLIPGIGECLRAQGALHTPFAWLSRSLAVQIGKTLVVGLPGSKKAVLEAADTLKKILPHALEITRGQQMEAGSHGLS